MLTILFRHGRQKLKLSNGSEGSKVVMRANRVFAARALLVRGAAIAPLVTRCKYRSSKSLN